jgi:hypothetical protein
LGDFEVGGGPDAEFGAFDLEVLVDAGEDEEEVGYAYCAVFVNMYEYKTREAVMRRTYRDRSRDRLLAVVSAVDSRSVVV